MLLSQPMLLQKRPVPFDRSEWIFELKYDGFRALAVTRNDGAQLISRNANNRYGVIALFEHDSARNNAGSPFIFFRPTLSAIVGYIFLRDSINNRSDSRP